jgi:hypothetical protein
MSGMSTGPRPKLDSANLNKLSNEKSPRKSSITRVASNLYDVIKGGKTFSSAQSEVGERLSMNSAF